MSTDIQERATFKLCDYDLKVQDYQQILVWAKELNRDRVYFQKARRRRISGIRG